jgi:hypothetical protein
LPGSLLECQPLAVDLLSRFAIDVFALPLAIRFGDPGVGSVAYGTGRLILLRWSGYDSSCYGLFRSAFDILVHPFRKDPAVFAVLE